MDKNPNNYRYVINDVDDEFFSGPYIGYKGAMEQFRIARASNPDIGLHLVCLDQKEQGNFNHTCEKCEAKFFSELEYDPYCGACEWEQEVDKLQEELDNKPVLDLYNKFNEANPNLAQRTEGQPFDNLVKANEPMTIPELKITEANSIKVYEMLIKPIIEKADEIINLLNGINPPKAKGKKSKDTQRLFNIADDLVAHHYKQPKKEEKIVFTNRANTEYKLVKEDLLDLGYQENYKDIFHKGLDPIVSRDKPVFGLGRVLQPLNKTISAMKKSIDEATSTANDRYNKHLEAQARAKAEAEAQAKAQTEAQGGKESANN